MTRSSVQRTPDGLSEATNLTVWYAAHGKAVVSADRISEAASFRTAVMLSTAPVRPRQVSTLVRHIPFLNNTMPSVSHTEPSITANHSNRPAI